MAGLDARRVRELPGYQVCRWCWEVVPTTHSGPLPARRLRRLPRRSNGRWTPRIPGFAFPARWSRSPACRASSRAGYPAVGPSGSPPPVRASSGLVVDAVNQESSTRRSFAWRTSRRRPSPTRRPGTCTGAFTPSVSRPISARGYAKRGVRLEITHQYLDKPELIGWCARNALKLLPLRRNAPGLAATADRAVASGRPLAISTTRPSATFTGTSFPIPGGPCDSARRSGRRRAGHADRLEPGAVSGAVRRSVEARALLPAAPAPAVTVVGAAHPAAGLRRRILLVNHREERCGVHDARPQPAPRPGAEPPLRPALHRVRERVRPRRRGRRSPARGRPLQPLPEHDALALAGDHQATRRGAPGDPARDHPGVGGRGHRRVVRRAPLPHRRSRSATLSSTACSG